MLSREQKENTQALQERFPEVYQDFFSSHQIVLSADFSYSMVSGLSWRVGAPNVRQKLPFRTYVGIKPNGKKGVIEFEQSYVYHGERQEFLESEYLTSVYKESTPKALREIIVEKLGTEDFEGFSFSVLAEREENLGFDSSLALLFTSSAFLYLGEIDKKTLDQFRSIDSQDLFSSDSEMGKKFSELHSFALKYAARVSHGVVSGVTSFTSLIDSSTPVVYVTEPRNGSVNKKYRHLRPLDVSGDYNQLDDLLREGYRLHELSDISGAFPMDVISIYPGSTRGYMSATKYVKDSLLPSFDVLRDKTSKLFSKVIKKHEGNAQRLPGFLQDTDEDGVYMQKYLDGQVYVRLHFLHTLINLYKNSLSSTVVAEFLESMNSFLGINTPFEESPSRNIKFIIRKIRKRAQEKGIDIAVRALYWGKHDGNIFVFSKPSKFREDIHEIVSELQQDYNPNVHLDYASWRDGWGGKGLRVEQDMKQGLYSEIVPAGSNQLLVWNGAEMETKLSNGSINANEYDVLFDGVNNEIHVGGKTFTSKDVPTKKATIELFTFLAQHAGEIMTNDKLPTSNYANYRNDLQGKVVGPIEKLIKQHLDKSLNVTISGELSRFAIQFDPKDISIGFLSPLNS